MDKRGTIELSHIHDTTFLQPFLLSLILVILNVTKFCVVNFCCTLQHAINWVSSDQPLDTVITMATGDAARLSAGKLV